MEPPATPNRARRPDYQRIAGELRQQIIEGKFAPGSRLPATEELAAIWRSSPYTVHTALAALSKEGWIERLHGAGTFVAETKARFTCAAIYHEVDIGSDQHSNYVRSIHDCLLQQLASLKKEALIFIDSRPMDKRKNLLPALADALQNRQVQCVIAPTATFKESPSLAKLAVPTAYAGNPGSPNRTNFDLEEFLREGLRSLASRGCRSVGLIGHFPYALQQEGASESVRAYYESLHKVIHEEGMTTHRDWISKWVGSRVTLEKLGYLSFQKLWKLRKKPDGLIVFPDTIVRGVITAILRYGIDIVPRQMKFVFHRNAHMDLLCPFPATWGISDEKVLAKRLIQIIEKQFRGEKVTPTLLPYEMQFEDGSQLR